MIRHCVDLDTHRTEWTMNVCIVYESHFGREWKQGSWKKKEFTHKLILTRSVISAVSTQHVVALKRVELRACGVCVCVCSRIKHGCLHCKRANKRWSLSIKDIEWTSAKDNIWPHAPLANNKKTVSICDREPFPCTNAASVLYCECNFHVSGQIAATNDRFRAGPKKKKKI